MKLHILVVEDQQLMSELIGYLLKPLREAHPESKVTFVVTWEEAMVELERVDHPDITFLDLTLKDSTRQETINNIPRMQTKTPVVIITSTIDDELVADARKLKVPILDKANITSRSLIGAILDSLRLTPLARSERRRLNNKLIDENCQAILANLPAEIRNAQ